MSNQTISVAILLRAGAEIVHLVRHSMIISVSGVACHPQQPVFTYVVDETFDSVLWPTEDLGLVSTDLT